jgi:hypothetical protein
MMSKLTYLLLFLSIDVLLYLRLGKKNVRAGYWLIAATVVWLIALVVHLPTFKLTHLMPFKDFLSLSGMIIQLVVIHYLGVFAIWRTERSRVTDDIKQHSVRILSTVFNTVIFFIFCITHLIFILSWPG